MRQVRKIVNRIAGDIKGVALVLILFLVYYLIMNAVFQAFCPLLILTGVPCAGCGLTRGVIFLLKGQALRAFSINPSVFLILLFLLYCGYFRYIKGEKVKGFSVALGVLVAGMLIIYGYRMYLYFPDKAPCVYKYDNLAAGWIPGYRKWMQELLRAIRLWRLA